jgi:outer membrane receptor protein involved in Fe transport
MLFNFSRTFRALKLQSRARVAFLVLLVLPLSSFAEEGERRIEEVVVTAERKEASVQDTSISITAFTDQFLDDFGIRNQEDMQNFIPATTIQPYDATVRGVGRNFRALGGDPGVSTYMNEVYSEDLLTATAATFWDVERVEILRGPQGTLYGRNAIGGAMNILYKKPSNEFEGSVKGIVGNYDTREIYGMLNLPIIKDQLMIRVNGARRDRDGVIDDIGVVGDSDGLDGLGTQNGALLLRWTPTETIDINFRKNWMNIDRPFGGANGGGLVVLNEEGLPFRNTTDIAAGYRFVFAEDEDGVPITNPLDSRWIDPSRPILEFTNPDTGAIDQAQYNRVGIDVANGFTGRNNPAAFLTNNLPRNAAEAEAQRLAGTVAGTSDEDAARYNGCVFPGKIKGDDVCAATNGQNNEEFVQTGTQFSIAWDATDALQFKYIYGRNELIYHRYTDDDNTGNPYWDRTFYVNHEADYESHEFQAFYDIGESLTFTSGIFFYDARIDQRGDFYPWQTNVRKFSEPYQDNTSLTQGAAEALICGVDPDTGIPLGCTGAVDPGTGLTDQETADALVGAPATALLGMQSEMVTLFSARDACQAQEGGCVRGTPDNPAGISAATSLWGGDDGSNRNLDVIHGPRTVGTDLLYTTVTEREAFAAYTQGVWDINELFTLTLGIRYGEDKLKAEENLWYYEETGGLNALYGGLAGINVVNGGLVDDGTGNLVPTDIATHEGVPFALSIHRPFERKDDKITWRANLDWDINDSAMMYFGITTGHRAGGYNLVFFSQTQTYDPEELMAYEIGYKTQFLEDTLQINGSFYYYDYETIHTVGTEVSVATGNTTTSVLPAPGAEIWGIEAEGTWLATDRLTLGGNFSYTPSKYTETLLLADPSQADVPNSLYPGFATRTEDIKGNQLLQVPDLKFTALGNYRFPLSGGSNLDINTVYSWIDKVYYSPFEREEESADSYGRWDARATLCE